MHAPLKLRADDSYATDKLLCRNEFGQVEKCRLIYNEDCDYLECECSNAPLFEVDKVWNGDEWIDLCEVEPEIP